MLASRPHGTLYIGVTNSLAQRMQLHRSGRGSEFVKQYGVNRLVYVEPYKNPQDAICREKQLKKWKREWKIELIERDNLSWSDLSNLIVE
jgi:putative endonuclease